MIRFRDLRHTHATRPLRAGTPVKVVSEGIGHASAAITLNAYAHVIPGDQQGTADGFAAAVDGV